MPHKPVARPKQSKTVKPEARGKARKFGNLANIILPISKFCHRIALAWGGVAMAWQA
jgi:hypothetical protein